MNSLLCQALRLIGPFDCPTSGRSDIFHPSLLQKASKAVSADYLGSHQIHAQMFGLSVESCRRELCENGVRKPDEIVGG